jgi:hypothetical protein
LEPELARAVVVSFRWAAAPDKPVEAVKAADGLAQQAAALGARLSAFGGYEIAMSFDPSDELLAIEFAARAVQQGGPVSKAGIAVGDIAELEEGDGNVALAWGEPSVVAAALARAAKPGEVLLDASVAHATNGSLSVSPSGRELTFGGAPRASYALDVEATVQAQGPVFADSVPPRSPSGSFEIIELAREALKRGDTSSLDAALKHLRVTGEHPEVVERLAGVLAMTRGAKEEGLRVLRKAAESEPREDRRARAVLAYAVGLAAAGRPEDALLEALSALSMTRQYADQSGEVACSTFLSQLSEASGHGNAAAAWQHVADRTSGPPGVHRS